MSKSVTKRSDISSPKVSNLPFLNSPLSVRSATDSVDVLNLNNQQNILSPTPAQSRKESMPLQNSAFLVPPETYTGFKKSRQSSSLMMKPNTSLSQSGKVFSNTGKNFYIRGDVQNDNVKAHQAKLASLMKKREEILQIKTWDDEQRSNIKRLLFFFQEMQSKMLDFPSNSEGFAIILLQLLTQAEYKVYNLLVSLSKTIEESFAENIKVSKKLAETQENLKNLEGNHQMKNKLEYERLEKLKKEVTQSIKNKDIMDNSQYLMIQKLKNENEYLQQQLENFANFQDFDKLYKELEIIKADSRVKCDQLENELRDRETLLSRYEIMYNGTKRMNENLNSVNKNMELKIAELVDERSQCQKVIDKIKEEKDMYRERSMMQLADYEGLQTELEVMQSNFVRMRERYFMEREKSDKLLDQYATQEKHDGVATFNQEAEVIESIKNALHVTPGKHLNIKKDQQNKNERDQDIDLKNFLIAKPSYLSFFAKNKTYLKMKSLRVNNNFIGMLRAIYDSKYNEILYADNYSQISRFPDFVYSWMGKFVLDPRTRKVRTADIKDSDPEILRNEMIVYFECPISSRLWECITFKEFLDEVHSRDELAYYLHCRHLLFKGPQLNDSSATFIFNYYVRLEWAEHVLEQLLGQKYTQETISLMKSKFEKRSKTKKGNKIIDSSFFLRVLLEEYKKDKIDRFLTYRKALTDDNAAPSPRNGKICLPFETFKAFLSTHFPETYEIEKAELYRKCWIYTNGSIDSEGVLTVLNEENFFIKRINFSGLSEKSVPKTLGGTPNYQLERTYEYIVDRFSTLSEEMDVLQLGITKLGVEKFLVDFQDFERRVRTHFSLETRGLQGKDIHLSLMSFFTRCLRLNHILLYLDGPEKGITTQNNIEDIFLTVNEKFKKLVNIEDSQVRDFELNVKAKKLQKFFKSKLSSWYKLIKFIIKNKLQKYYDDSGSLHFKTK